MASETMKEIWAIKERCSKMTDAEREIAEKNACAWFEKMSKKPVVYVENTSSPRKNAKKAV